ncbi:MAG: phosphoribosylamine--glycine ligase [Coriobacteriia bacterium]|nr:phosphoribosylamine--glycine ligase [Coriobacteriia bacterium]
MRILVLGSGGREHAIIRKLSESARHPEIFAAPGNGGTATLATNVEGLDIASPDAVAEFAKANDVDLVVIGPEGPLVAGVADAVEEAGIAVFGPRLSGARMEGSKAFAKGVMRRHSIPTGESRCFTRGDLAREYLRERGTPIVVKADGLAAGKGVTVAFSYEEAEAALEECFSGRFGAAGTTVLIEDFLAGPECSLLAFTDGETVVPMAPAQDHKRAFDGDGGPNTGGMGVYTPVPAVDHRALAAMVDALERTVAGLKKEGIRYRGVLYGGFILTEDGPMVLEYNARFGDPETQVLLPRLDADLIDIMLAVSAGTLADIPVLWSRDAAVSVVLASGGYPGEYETGKVITGIDAAEEIPGVTVYHAGTAMREDGALVTAGGRVLNVTALAPTLAEARERAYEAVALIAFDGAFHRSDIAVRALEANS